MVQIGIASDEVKLLAKEKNADIIVMGMKGAGGLDKIIGSTTTNVIRKVKVPVLVIPEKATYQAIQHITYAYDLNDPSGRPFSSHCLIWQLLTRAGSLFFMFKVLPRLKKMQCPAMPRWKTFSWEGR